MIDSILKIIANISGLVFGIFGRKNDPAIVKNKENQQEITQKDKIEKAIEEKNTNELRKAITN